MASIICPVRIPCPGTDSPILNDSSELPEVLYFSSYSWTKPDPPLCLSCAPPNPAVARDCFGIEHSAVSQAEADLLAIAASVNCNNPNASKCVNEAQTATKSCPNGEVISFTTAAGSIVSTYTSDNAAACLAAANAQALAYAQQQVALMPINCGNVICTITPATGMPTGTVGTAYSQQITGVGFPLPNVLEVTAGSLPPGLTMDSDGTIYGTPTTAGTYNFTVQLDCG